MGRHRRGRPLLPLVVLLATPSIGVVALPSTLDAALSRGMLASFTSPLAAPSSSAPAVAVGDCEVWILGTVHLGSESAFEARELIAAVEPDVVVLEMPPLRLAAISKATLTPRPAATPPGALFAPLISRGLKVYGLSGALVCAILWWELYTRSTTKDEEEAVMPRMDEFVAAATAATASAASTTAQVVAADWETDDLIMRAAAAMSVGEWVRLGAASAVDALTGARDPLKRRRTAAGNEPVTAWADRRRDIETSRASRAFAEARSPALERVLVDDRNAAFVQAARSAAREAVSEAMGQAVERATREGLNDGAAAAEAAAQPRRVVFCVGLVHLDGLKSRLLAS